VTSCARCDRHIEAGRAVYVAGVPYCGWPDAKAESRRLGLQAGIIYQRTCELATCGAEFTSRHPLARFCCRAHTLAAANARSREDPAASAPRPRSYEERIGDLEAGLARIIGPPVPDLEGAACVSSTMLPADAWSQPADSDLGQAAMFICAGCPVLDPCRSWAVDLGRHQDGIIGGMSASERRREHARRERGKRRRADDTDGGQGGQPGRFPPDHTGADAGPIARSLHRPSGPDDRRMD